MGTNQCYEETQIQARQKIPRNYLHGIYTTSMKNKSLTRFRMKQPELQLEPPNLDCLYNEVKWESLEKRRRNHKLTLFYKMYTNLTPSYLSDLVPQTVSSVSRYNLRNSHALQTVDARSNNYYYSFLPSTVREWNNLPSDVTQSESIAAFATILEILMLSKLLTPDLTIITIHFFHQQWGSGIIYRLMLLSQNQ